MALPAETFGSYFVKPTGTAISKAWKLCDGRMRPYQILRRHAQKLAYWPTGTDNGEAGADLDWDWIKSLERKRVGELRVDEPVNGHVNLRIIFFKANHALPGESMNRIWILTVYPKKNQQFSSKELRAFEAMRDIIVGRHYGSSQNA